MKAWHETAVSLKIANPLLTSEEISGVVRRSPEAVQKALKRARDRGEFQLADDVQMSVTIGETIEKTVENALVTALDTLNDTDVPIEQKAKLAVAILNGPLTIK